jgi:hypothetical protein
VQRTIPQLVEQNNNAAGAYRQAVTDAENSMMPQADAAA